MRRRIRDQSRDRRPRRPDAQHRLRPLAQRSASAVKSSPLSDPPTICSTDRGENESSAATAASGIVAIESLNHRTPSDSCTS